MRLFQSKSNYLREIRIYNIFFSNNSKQQPLWYLVLYIPELQRILIFIVCILVLYAL